MGSPDRADGTAVLRNTNASLRRFGLLFAGLLGPATVLVATGVWSSVEGLVLTLVPMLAAVPITVQRFFKRYTVRGTVLEIRSLFRRVEIDLPATEAVALRVTGDRGEARRLVMILNGDVRIVLGDATTPSFFEPQALFALASALQQSELVGPHEVGQQIQRLAEHPSFESWPDQGVKE